MLFCAKADSAAVQTADAGKIRLGGGFRLPVTTADAGKIRDVFGIPKFLW